MNILSDKLKSFDEWNDQFYERLPLSNKEVEKLKQFLTSFYKEILERIRNEIEAKIVIVHAVQSGSSEYQAGKIDALKNMLDCEILDLSSLIDSKKQLLSITNIK